MEDWDMVGVIWLHDLYTVHRPKLPSTDMLSANVMLFLHSVTQPPGVGGNL